MLLATAGRDADGFTIRAGRDEDGPAIIALISSAWGEYPGVFMDVDGENPELRALASYFAEAGGMLWVAEQDGALLGSVATRPAGAGSWELCRMYVAAHTRGAGLAARLLSVAEDHARGHGAKRMHLWTDTRFDRAHRFYARHGYLRDGGIKPLMDASNTLDFGYAKPLAGLVVSALDTAAAASAARSLGRLMSVCVDAGASISFLPPLALAVSEAFFRSRASEVATGRRVLLVAWLEGSLVGTVMVDLAMPANQPHRAEIQKLFVHPAARRRGVARALMQAAEAAAGQAGRSLLTLDTRSGDDAERLYAAMGWTRAGEIPGFALSADGSLHATTLFYKQIPGPI